MSKFKVGEIAIYVGTPGAGVLPDLGSRRGQEVEIIDPLASRANEYTMISVGREIPRYGVRFRCGRESWVLESSLRKRPDDNLFTQWFETHIITDIRPTEIQVREGVKNV